MAERQHARPAGAEVPRIPEPSLAERARSLAALGKLGSLATWSRHLKGFPFCSMMPYAVDGSGRPIFFISTMAMHTQNIVTDARVSLLVIQPDAADDPLGSARLTLAGTAVEAPAGECREIYMRRHENARYWQDFADFAYYRVEIEGVYFIGGFGVMGWVTPADYAAAAPDPLLDLAASIIQHMNADHADALLRIANRSAEEPAEEASMTSVDRLGFHVRLRSGDRVHGLRIAFPREVTNADEARRVFVEMAKPTKPSQ